MDKGRTSQDSPNVSKTRPSPQIGVQTVLSTVSTFRPSLVQPKQSSFSDLCSIPARNSIHAYSVLREEALLPPSALKFSATLLSGLNSIIRESVSGASVLHTVMEQKMMFRFFRRVCIRFSIHIFNAFLQRFIGVYPCQLPSPAIRCVVPLTSSRGPPASKRSRFPKLASRSSLVPSVKKLEKSSSQYEASQEAKKWKSQNMTTFCCMGHAKILGH